MAARWVIDSLAFAKKGEILSGNIAITDLARLRDKLFSDEGSVSFTLRGMSDASRRPVIDCIIAGELHLTCQRCLGALTYPLKLERRFMLVPDEQHMPQIEEEDPDVDCIVAQAHMEVAELVEDEIILGLPMAPVHEPGQCGPGAGPLGKPQTGSGSFEGLAAIRKRNA